MMCALAVYIAQQVVTHVWHVDFEFARHSLLRGQYVLYVKVTIVI